MTDPVNLRPPSIDHVLVGEAAALVRSARLRIDAFNILIGASRLPHLPDVVREQLLCSARIAGLTLHRVKGAYGTPSDCEEMGRDLRSLCRIVDPLIAAIGEAAVVDLDMSPDNLKLFRDQLFTALDGNAIYAIEVELVEKMREDANG